MLLLPTSHGSVKLIAALPTDDPAIDISYYDAAVDRAVLIYGIRSVIKARPTD